MASPPRDDLVIRPWAGEPDRPGIGGTDRDGGQAPYCLVADVGGETVGYGWTRRWTEADGTRLYLLLGRVAPAWRGRGIGRELLRRQEEGAVAAAEAEGTTGTAVLGANAEPDEDAARRLLLAAGYRVVFSVVDLECAPAPGTPTEPRLPAGLVERPVAADHHPRIHAAIEECFAEPGHYAAPRSYQQYRADVRERQADTGLWCVAWDGDEVAGVVITELTADGGGLTPWVAVRAPWRRLGLGKTLVTATLGRLAARGVTRARLSTVAENPHDTLSFYGNLGYHETARHPRYRKAPG